MAQSRVRKVVLRTKSSYRQASYSRGVLHILLALDTVCRHRLPGVPRTLTLTAGTDSHTAGAHPAPRAEAVDVRSTTFRSGVAKRRFLLAVTGELADLANDGYWEDEVDGGYEILTDDYFLALEAEHEEDEHFHVQVRKGHTIGLPSQRAEI